MQKTLTGLILASLLALALSGCWGDDPAPRPTASPLPSPAHTTRPWTSPQPAPEYTPAPERTTAPGTAPDASRAPQGRAAW